MIIFHNSHCKKYKPYLGANVAQADCAPVKCEKKNFALVGEAGVDRSFHTFLRGNSKARRSNASRPASSNRYIVLSASCSAESQIQRIGRTGWRARGKKSEITQINSCDMWHYVPAVLWPVIWRTLLDSLNPFDELSDALPFRHLQLLISFNDWHDCLLLLVV